MKSYRLICLFCLMFLLLINCSCSQNKNDDNINEKDDIKVYEIDNLSTYNVDKDGSLYVVGQVKNENITSEYDISFLSYIHKYSKDGNLEFSHTFDSSVSINALTSNGDMIYFASSGLTKEGVGMILYSYNIKTNQMERIYEFDYFENIKQLIYLDERIYIIGNKPYSSVKSNDAKNSYQSMGEKLLYYSLNEKIVYELGINYPISMSLNEDTLMINAYMENDGYCLLKYDPKSDSIKMVTSFDSNKFGRFAVCDNASKIIYTYDINSRGLVMSDLSSLDKEAEIYPEVFPFDTDVFHMNGQIYCVNHSRDIVRISIDPDKMDYPVIRYISTSTVDGPFGCGYTMERMELTEDKLAIKVLARDKDYDICYMSSLRTSSYNIKKNGIFLPLNKVKGINEYLDACFPYVKDIAVNEHGDIWMLPIVVDIPGLLVNEDYITIENVPLKNNMTYEEFCHIYSGLNEKLVNKTEMHPITIYKNFIAQTINKSSNINTNQFKNTLRLFQRNKNLLKSSISFDWNDEYLFLDCSLSLYYDAALKLINNLEPMRIYSMPKLNPTDKNLGTCTFLVVNANSSNKKTVLAYLEDLIAHIMNQETTPYYFKEPVPEKDTLRGSLYELYENGEISFYIDEDTYSGFEEVIESGTDKDIDEYIKETERKLDIYFNE